MTTPSATRPPSTMCPCTNYYDDIDDKSSTASQHHQYQQQAAAPSAFFTHVVYQNRSDSDIDASQSSSSLPAENTLITSVTNSTDSTPLHSLPGAGPRRPPERAGGPEIQSNSHHHLLHHYHTQNGATAKRSHSYSLGNGSPAQYASVNSLSAAYHRPTYAFGTTLK